MCDAPKPVVLATRHAHLHNLNCANVAQVEVALHGGTVVSGWAMGPGPGGTPTRMQHQWVMRDLQVIDLLGWTDHQAVYEPARFPKSTLLETVTYLEDIYEVDWPTCTQGMTILDLRRNLERLV